MPRNLGISIAILLAAIAAMALYGFHLHRQALELQASTMTQLKPVAPPAQGPAQQITLLVPDDDSGILVRRDATVSLPAEPSLRAHGILDALVAACKEENSTHPLGDAAAVKAVFLVDNNRTAVVVVNDEFASQHRSGILVEELTLMSMARTLGANMQGVSQMKVLVNGKEQETLAGHADLTDFYPTNVEWKVE